MKHKLLNTRNLSITGLILIAAVMRLVPHWPNFTPVAAIALFGGAYLNRRHLAFIIPLAALFASDLVLGFHNYMIPVYACFALTVGMGILMQKAVRPLSVVIAALASSLIFFLITNFAVWLIGPNYTADFGGLMQCYTVALPFLYNGIVGDLFYSVMLFGGFYIAAQRFPQLRQEVVS